MTPSPPRSIPNPVLEKIELSRIALPVPAVASTSTPMPVEKAMVLPAPAAVPPIVLLDEPPSIWMPLPLPSGIRAGDVGADQVALDQCAGRARVEPDAGGRIGRDDVPVAGRRAADRDPGGAAHDARRRSRCRGPRAGVVGADAVAQDQRRRSWRSPRSTRPPARWPRSRCPRPATVPPMVTPEASSTDTPEPVLGSGLVPVWSVPM